MGVILKENQIVYTKRKHEKFLGSSAYRFDQGKFSIIRKEKLPPVVPVDESLNISAVELKKESVFWMENSKGFAFEGERINRFVSACSLDNSEEIIKREKKTEYILNKKKVREKCAAFFGLRQSRKFLAFYSISFPQNFPDDAAFKCFNTVLTRLRKDCGLKSYLWVTERQKNGTIHFHMLTNNYMYVRKFNRYMAVAIETQIKKQGIEVNYCMEKYNGVDVRHVNNNRKALNMYLTKYVSKNSVVFFRLPYHSSRDISELFTCETFPHVNSADFQPIRNTLMHIQTFVVDNEYCTIEYLCQDQGDGKYFNPPDEWYWLLHFVNEQIYIQHHRSKICPKLNILKLYDNTKEI